MTWSLDTPTCTAFILKERLPVRIPDHGEHVSSILSRFPIAAKQRGHSSRLGHHRRDVPLPHVLPDSSACRPRAMQTGAELLGIVIKKQESEVHQRLPPLPAHLLTLLASVSLSGRVLSVCQNPLCAVDAPSARSAVRQIHRPEP